MSIRPVDMSAMIQRTQDVGNIKHNQDHRPVVEQHVIQAEHVKKEDQQAHKVMQTKDKTNDAYRYDAKDKGNNQYAGDGGKQRGKNGKQGKNDDKVVQKQFMHGFDIKI